MHFSPAEIRAFAATAEAIGSAALARRLGVSPDRVRQWRCRAGKRRIVDAPTLVPDVADLAEIPVTDRLRSALDEHGTMGAAISALGLRKKDLAGVDWALFGGGLQEIPRAPAYLITYAQNDTSVHSGFWRNLEAYAGAIGAQILVGAGTYQVGLYSDHAADPTFYDRRCRPFIVRSNDRIFGDIIFAATANLLPTVPAPLTKWRTRGGRASVIVPHVKQHLESVPRMLDHDPKIVWSTGSCTIANYAPRAAGQAAAWHHAIGCVIVEHDGQDWHARHITGDDETGDFQDLDVLVQDGVVSTGVAIDTLVAGDIHAAQADPTVVQATWGLSLSGRTRVRCGIVPDLRPARQVVHDVLDFYNRNHHERGRVKARLERLVAGRTSVAEELRQTSALLRGISRTGIETVVVKSNHDDALDRWLDSDDGGKDEANVVLWHRLNAIHCEAISARRDIDIFRTAMELDGGIRGATWPRRFASHEVDYPSGAIEYNLHGDKGNGGSRGSPMGFVRAAPKIISAHSHTPFRREGHGSVGTSTKMDMAYNRGLSTWAHAHIAVYPSGHWTHVFIKSGRWRRPANENAIVEMEAAA
ncbi:MAG: hypothetical protein ABJF67_16885 [Aurantimonas coralicida]